MSMPVSRMSGLSNVSLRKLLPSTKLRNLGMRERRQLVGILSINDSWRDLAGIIRNPDNPDEYLYKVHDISFLESQWKAGRNPAEALLDDWSITGRQQPDLNDLLMVLQEAQLLRAAYYVQTELLKLPDDTKEAESASENIDTILKYKSQSSNTLVAEMESTVKTFEGIDISELTVFSYNVLSRATQDFYNLNIEKGGCKIGEGAFGCVYLANISGRRVAVKKLKGDVDKQFFTELKILVRCHHENLVPLLGFSNDGPRCCLVYEYMPNGSLQARLACVGKTPPISSDVRLSIAYGSALGINQLHTFAEEPLVHRDIKSANILLDVNFVPKVADFGLVRIGDANISSTVAVTQNVCGTSVYMAREAFIGDVSIKLDTFSFGVVLLELLTGLPPYDVTREDRDLVTFMENCDDVDEVLDIKAYWDPIKAAELLRIAQLCLTNAKKHRPTIAEILEDLKRCCLIVNDAQR